MRTEWANLDHAVIAADVCQWRCRFSACVRAAAVISNTAFNSDVVFLKPSLSTCSRIGQLQADITYLLTRMQKTDGKYRGRVSKSAACSVF